MGASRDRTQSPDFLGRGAAFPLRPIAGGGPLAPASGEEKIRQSIWAILTTAPGERVMRPDFGCGIHDLVFATMSDGAIGRIVESVRTALARWERRIEVLQVAAIPDPREPHKLQISIDYAIRATNSRRNLVYPFYAS